MKFRLIDEVKCVYALVLNDAKVWLVVDVDPEIAISRLVQFRNMNEEDARRRMASQASREERLIVADRVIDNSGSPDALDSQVDEVWDWFATLPNAQQGAGALTQKSK